MRPQLVVIEEEPRIERTTIRLCVDLRNPAADAVFSARDAGDPEPAVEQRDAKVVVLDSLNGFLNAMPEERHLTLHLHELLMYLGQKGVATILVAAHQGLVGNQMVTPVDASYLADAVILLRYFEDRGEVRQAVSVMKKRGSKHERTLREFRLDGGRISVGGILREFRGVLTGVPFYEGSLTGTKDNE